jgi:RHS repeat-associated protein
VRSQTETPKRYRYTGKERDGENGLDYVGARYYASWLGRWTAVDPAGHRDAPSLYVYVAANPIRLRDPNGRAAEDETAKTTSEPAGEPKEEESFKEKVAEALGYAADTAHIVDAVLHKLAHAAAHHSYHAFTETFDAASSEEETLHAISEWLEKAELATKLGKYARGFGIAGGVLAAIETAVDSKHESKTATGVDAVATGGVETAVALLAGVFGGIDSAVNLVGKAVFGKQRSYGLVSHATYTVHLVTALGFGETRTKDEYLDELLAGKGPVLFAGEALALKKLHLVGALYKATPHYLVSNDELASEPRTAHVTHIPKVNTWFEPVVIHRRHSHGGKHAAMHFKPVVIHLPKHHAHHSHHRPKQ